MSHLPSAGCSSGRSQRNESCLVVVPQVPPHLAASQSLIHERHFSASDSDLFVFLLGSKDPFRCLALMGVAEDLLQLGSISRLGLGFLPLRYLDFSTPEAVGEVFI